MENVTFLNKKCAIIIASATSSIFYPHTNLCYNNSRAYNPSFGITGYDAAYLEKISSFDDGHCSVRFYNEQRNCTNGAAN